MLNIDVYFTPELGRIAASPGVDDATATLIKEELALRKKDRKRGPLMPVASEPETETEEPPPVPPVPPVPEEPEPVPPVPDEPETEEPEPEHRVGRGRRN